MTNLGKRTSYLRQLVSVARSIVTYQAGLPHGCARISKILGWLRPFESLSFPVFGEYAVATRELPTGSERLTWNRDALRERDIRLEAINREFRDRVFDACYEIIDRYGTSHEDPTGSGEL